MATILEQKKVLKLDVKNINDAASREITRKFGKAEDFVEVHIYSLNGKLLQSIPNFTDYTLPELTEESGDNLVNEINIDFDSALRSLGYRSGAYDVHINIQRRKIFNQRRSAFTLKDISPSKTELRLETNNSNNELSANAREFIDLLRGSPLFRDFNLNFGKNINLLGVNLDIDTSNPDKFALLVKLLKPLPGNITVGDKLNITEEIVEPLVTTYDLGLPTLIEQEATLRGPNFKIDVRLNDTIPTSLKSYNDILSTDTTSSYQKLLSKLEGYEIPEIDYSYIRPTESASIEAGEMAPSHFENFVHFGSATERLNNFEYKLKLLELYQTQLDNINDISGSTSQSSVVLNTTASIASKKEKLIQDFDGYERFLYFESGTYSWPKTNSSEPYAQVHTTSSEALVWLGSSIDTNPNYGGQLLSSSIFDTQNQNNLINTIPNHIGDRDENAPYLLFCNMIGNFFDPIWAHIKEITQIRNNSHIYGVSKDLVYYTLKSLGIDAHDQFENQDLVNYILESKTTTIGELKTKVISGSNNIPSKGDITKEIWKRLYHNAPYLLKTKGTARGLQALISCYGIPDTVLNVKEYMGSAPNRDDFNTFTYNKYLRILEGDSSNNQGFFVESQFSGSLVAPLSASEKTIEFRAKPYRSNSQMHLLTLSSSISSSDLHLQLHPYTGSHDFYEENDRTQYGKLVLHQFTSSIAESSGVGRKISPTELVNLNEISSDSNNGTILSITSYNFASNTSGGNQFVNNITSENLVAGRTYKISAVLSNYAGTGDVGFSNSGGVSGTARRSTNGLIEETFVASGTTTNALQPDLFIANGVTAATLSNITIKEILIPEGYFPIYNGEFWDLYLNTDGASGSNATLGFGAYQANHLQEVNHFTQSVTISEKENAEIFGNPFYNSGSLHGANVLYLGGIRTGSSNYTTTVTGSSFDLEYSGSINEFRLYFGERLSHDTLTKHALEPFMYAGNSPTSSFNTLVARYPLSFELEDSVGNNETFIPSGSLTDSGSIDASNNPIYAANAWNQNPTASADQNQALLDANAPITGGAILDENAVSIIQNQPGFPNHEPIFVVAGTPLLSSHHPNQNVRYLEAFSYLDDNNLSNHEEKHHLITPNSVGRLTANNKIKIDSGSVNDDILSTDVLTQTPTLNRQGVDYDEVGVFFSPQNELNEDIIYTLGHFSVDNTLGDPRHQTSSYYPDLQALKDHYFQKLTAGSHRLNVFDFTRLVQFTDHTLFEMVKKFTPQKANLKTGLLIEPHYLERVKFERHHPIKSQILLETELSEITQSFTKNNNISALDSTSGSTVITQYNFIGTGSNGRPLQSGYNTAIDFNKTFTGSAAWEHGPILPVSLHVSTNATPNLVTNGRFETNTDWVTGSVGWYIEGNQLHFTGSNYTSVEQVLPNLITNREYEVKFVLKTDDNVANPENSRFVVELGGTSTGLPASVSSSLVPHISGGVEDGLVRLVLKAGADTNKKLKFFPGSAGTRWTGSVCDVSVRELGFKTKARYSDTIRFEDYNGPISLHPSGGNSPDLYGTEPSIHINIEPHGNNTRSPYGVYKKGKLSKNYFITPGNPRTNHGLTTGSINVIQNGDFSDGSTGWSATNTAIAGGVANFNGFIGAGGYPSITQRYVRRGGFGDKYEVTFTVTDWNNGAAGYSTLRLNFGMYPNEGVPNDVLNTSQTGYADTLFPLLMDSNTVQLNTPIKKTFISDGNNSIQFYVSPNDADISITNLELRKIEDRQSVRFDDSILDTKGWKSLRYDGSKLIGNKINEFTPGDITYGKNPVVGKKSTSIYFGTNLVGADGEEDPELITLKKHSYINIDSIISIDDETDSIEVINTSAVPYNSYQRLIANDLSQDKDFEVKILDKNIENKKKNRYTSKFSQGLLYKTVEHKGINGTGNIHGEGIQAGHIYSASYQNGPYTYHKTPNLVKNPHLYSFGPEIIIDGNFTGSYAAGEPNPTWIIGNYSGSSFNYNTEGDGIFIQTIPGTSGQFSALRNKFPIELEDGAFYRWEFTAVGIDNGGDTITAHPIVVGDNLAGRGGNANAYRPMGSGDNSFFEGRNIYDFRHDTSLNNGSDFVALLFEMKNGNTFEKSVRFKNISLRKATPAHSQFDVTNDIGTAWVLANGRAIANDSSQGWLNINNLSLETGKTYEFEIDIVCETNNVINGLKLANVLDGGSSNLEIQRVNGVYTGHQKIRWVHDGSQNHRLRLYNSTTWAGYVTNFRLHEVEPYDTNGNVFVYGKHTNTMNISTLEIFQNDFTREIWHKEDTFGLIDMVTSSANYYYDSIENIARLYDSRLLPFASESQRRLFVTFQDGQPIRARKGIDIPSNVGLKTISTAELDLETYNYYDENTVVYHKGGGESTAVFGGDGVNTLDYTSSLLMNSHSFHNIVSGAMHDHPVSMSNDSIDTYDSTEFAGTTRPIAQPYYLYIPLKKEAHDIAESYKLRRGGNTSNWKGVAQNIFGQAIKLNFVFSGNSNQNAKYQISYLEEKPAIIANVNKTVEFKNGTGEKGYIIIPENLDKNIKNNLDYYLSKLELISDKDIKKIPKQKE
tara:strand:- start:5452 stop:13095 length:7644 start_codon:yes stop_codon:yes gene_type:complete